MSKMFNCDGYWKTDISAGTTETSFSNMIVSDDEWDGIEDAKDEKVFFYTDGYPVVGDHGEFVITKAEEIV